MSRNSFVETGRTNGFDLEKMILYHFWPDKQLHHPDRNLLQALLHAAAVALKEEIPG